jgi:CoA:oxalate CoA-transferase
MSDKPLAGTIVIDLTRVLAGPFCTMILGDLGAEVIKVEVPGSGDDSRHFGPFINGNRETSAYFISINCGKKSLTLDLKSAGGREVFADLLKKADVLVENYRPGTLARLGFSAADIRCLNPALIYASASGFGHSGRDAGKAAYDMIIQARSGLMSITGTEDGTMVRVGSSISDIVTGMYTAMGVLAALVRRGRSGNGARVDVAMLDSTVSILENAIARYQVNGSAPGPLGARHPSITPFAEFATADGSVIIAAGNDKLFRALCKVLEREELAADSRFKTNDLRTENYLVLKEEIEHSLKKKDTASWLSALNTVQVPCARCNTMADVFDDDQVADRGMLVEVEGMGGFRVAGSPLKIDGVDEKLRRERAPALGQHNETVLKDLLGYNTKKIENLSESGVFG